MPRSPEEKILLLSARIPFLEKDKNKIKCLLTQEVNWNSLIRLATSSDILPLIAKNLLEIDNNLIPKDILGMNYERCRKEYTLNNLILWNEFKQIHNIAKNLGITILPIKGIILTEILYKDIGLRRTSDIDILIKAEGLSRMKEEVKNLGYIHNPEELNFISHSQDYLKSIFHLSFIKKGSMDRPVVLNLHWDILPSSGVSVRFNGMRINNLINDFWHNAVFQKLSNQDILTLSYEDLLFESAIELYKDIIDNRRFLFKRIIDIAQILQEYRRRIDWDEFIKRTDIYGLKGLIYYIISLNKELFNNDILPEGIINRLKPSYVKRIFITNLINQDFSEEISGFLKLLYYFFISEVILLSNRWKVFLLRFFYWRYPEIYLYKRNRCVYYFIAHSLNSIKNFLRKILKKILK